MKRERKEQFYIVDTFQQQKPEHSHKPSLEVKNDKNYVLFRATSSLTFRQPQSLVSL